MVLEYSDAKAETFIRFGKLTDLDALVHIERQCFDSDRLSRRSFRHFLQRGKGALLVCETGEAVVGYVLVHIHAGTVLARLYSFAVLPETQGSGIGRTLLEAAEQTAREQGCLAIRLEIRRDNERAKALYLSAGYREFEQLEDYYEDHQDAVRMEKSLARRSDRDVVPVPYYEQTLEFTCGPASLMMAMKCLNPKLVLDRKLELQIWREATTIFMTSGHGGCGPYGLALAAHHRGFGVQVIVRDARTMFVDSVRSPEKKAVLELVHEDFHEQILAAGIAVHHREAILDDIETALSAGAVPLALISSYRLYGEKSPHWVTVTGTHASTLYLHDPYIDLDNHRTALDSMYLPIHRQEFERMARYGRSGQYALVIISRPKDKR
ncbi:MAG TPA: ribosomal-protein-alanine N-acetyltransferase [Porticoccaceae bacterium]|nr:ribosomal-protein-alanine N-acetyltransferase [Porticoccaceae bacterium]